MRAVLKSARNAHSGPIHRLGFTDRLMRAEKPSRLLGLALVLRIAQLHSGSVEIGRGTYGGARVTVTLRCLAAQNQESCHQAAPGDTIALVEHTHCDSGGH